MTGPSEPQYPQDPQNPPHYPAQPQYSGQPQYPPQPQYPGQPPSPYPPQYGSQYPPDYPSQYAPQPQRAGRAGLAQRLGPRVDRRPQPRLGVSLAGVGVALAVAGVVAWGGTYIADAPASDFGGDGGSSSRNYLGAFLALLVVAIGYGLLIAARRGALVTAGIAASALGVPVAMAFFTLSTSGGSPFNFDAIVWVSLVVYVLSYLFVRGAQGHTFYVGSSLFLFWIYLLDKAAPSATEFASSFAFRFVPDSGLSGDVGSGQSLSLSTVGGVSLVVGACYYVVAWLLDRAGRRGVAVAFALVGFPAVYVGIGTLSDDLKQVGTGVLLVLVGIVLAGYGARNDRRFTTWIWAVGAGVGGILIVAKLTDSSTGTAIGIALIVLGALFVAGGALLAKALDEPDDITVSPERV